MKNSWSNDFAKDETAKLMSHQFFTNYLNLNSKRKIKLISLKDQKFFIHVDNFVAENLQQELFIIDNIYDQFLFLEVAAGLKSALQGLQQAYDYRDYAFNARHFFKLMVEKANKKNRLIDENLQRQLQNILEERKKELLELKNPKFISPFLMANMVVQGLDIAVQQALTSTSLPKTHPRMHDQMHLILAIINLAIKNCGLQNRFQIDAEINDNRSEYFLRKTDNNFPLSEILLQIEKIKSHFRFGWKACANYFVKPFELQEELDFYQIFAALYQNENNFLKIENLICVISKESFLDFQSKIAGTKVNLSDSKIISSPSPNEQKIYLQDLFSLDLAGLDG